MPPLCNGIDGITCTALFKERFLALAIREHGFVFDLLNCIFFSCLLAGDGDSLSIVLFE